MHPILAGRGTALLYLAAWFLLGILMAALLTISGSFPASAAAAVVLPLMLLYAFINLSSYYLCRAFPLGTTSFVKILATFFIAGCVSSAIWTATGNAWAWVLERFASIPSVSELYVREVPMLFGAGLLLFLLTAVVQYVLITFERAREVERQSYELRLLAQDAELRLLRAQIDPHFLFNSLNSVSALISSDPVHAREMVIKLADFLRESLRVGPLDRIALQEEVALATEYLAIEQVRFGPRLGVNIEIDAEASSCLVPPLLLQPVVENAVRHGIAHLLEGGRIRILASRRPGGLTLTVENPCDPDRPRRTGTGLGLKNVRSRLRTLHGSDARVDVEESNGYFSVVIVLPIVS